MKNGKSFIIQPVKFIYSTNKEIIFEGYYLRNTPYGDVVYLNATTGRLFGYRNAIAHESLHVMEDDYGNLAHTGDDNHPEIIVLNDVLKMVDKLEVLEPQTFGILESDEKYLRERYVNMNLGAA